MNNLLLNKIVDFFRAEPRRLDMEDWHNGDALEEYDPPCGTTACIAGAACILAGTAQKADSDDSRYIYYAPNGGWAESGANILGLNPPQADRLFRRTSESFGILNRAEDVWPKNYATAYVKAKTPAERLKVTINRIKHFIKTEEAE